MSDVNVKALWEFYGSLVEGLENFRLQLLQTYGGEAHEVTLGRFMATVVRLYIIFRDVDFAIANSLGIEPPEDDLAEVSQVLLSAMELKRRPGRPVVGKTRLLFLDALLLKRRPGGYLQFARDALTLQAPEYPVRKGYARAYTERWHDFGRARKTAETTAKRLWRRLCKAEPEKLPDDWWLQVADQQGLRRPLD